MSFSSYALPTSPWPRRKVLLLFLFIHLLPPLVLLLFLIFLLRLLLVAPDQDNVQGRELGKLHCEAGDGAASANDAASWHCLTQGGAEGE